MSGAAKAEVIEKVQVSSLPVSKVLTELGVPRSTYYRWIKPKHPLASRTVRVPWNRLLKWLAFGGRSLPELVT